MCKAPLPSASSTPLSMMKKSTHPSGPPPPISSSRRRLPGLPRRTTCNFSVLLHPQGSRPSRLLRSTKLRSIKNGQLRFRLPSSSWTKTCAPFPRQCPTDSRLATGLRRRRRQRPCRCSAIPLAPLLLECTGAIRACPAAMRFTQVATATSCLTRTIVKPDMAAATAMWLGAQPPSSSSRTRGQEVSRVIERRKLCCEIIDLQSQATIWPRKICTRKAVSPVESLGGGGHGLYIITYIHN